MGGDVEVPPEGEYLSENYGMARADEGSAAWCVLTGEGYGGHRDHVLGLVSEALLPRYHSEQTLSFRTS